MTLLSVTIKHVAQRAGVSPKTVSRVVNGEPGVREPTRLLVERAIAELGYQPNLAARSLVAARSFVLGLISMRLDAHVFRSLHTAGIRACRERGLHLVAEELDDISPATLRRLEGSLRQMRFDGVVVSQVADVEELLALLERFELPYVRLSPTTQPGRADAVCSDITQGLQLLAEHLWALGHRHFALPLADQWRHDLLREILLGLGCEPSRIVSVPLNWRDLPMESGVRLAMAVLSLPERPTAVFAYNDEVAAAFIHHAWAHGVHVPRDLSVVGFDDAEVARVTWPATTTVHQPYDQMIRAAVKLLAEPRAAAPREIVCPVQLVIRGSTAPPPAP